ncbi:hypothetical protein EB796_018091 [Bugula neritina]|uniref:Uncharacterized protein n=1 Tax=Bugula neritina TaxID=10212 RepID=A0A7J7JC66_BUGNE|nr:hypothetical protein EB796_018091 [Bugula neritina]
MGLGSSSIGEYAQSFQYHQLALKMMNASFGEETGHPEKAKVYTKMAIMYIRMGDYTKALEQLFYSVDMISKAFEKPVPLTWLLATIDILGLHTDILDSLKKRNTTSICL